MSSPYSGSTSAGAHTGPSTQEIQVQGNVTAPYPQEQYPQEQYPPEQYPPEQYPPEQYPPEQYAQEAAFGAHSGDRGTPMTAEGRPDVEGASVGQLLGEVSKDLSTLMRQELELAKAELTAEAKKAGQGAGMFGAAGFAGYMVLIFLSLAAMWGLAAVMPVGWAGLIVAGIWAVIGAVAFAMGRRKFQQLHPKPERTVDTLQQVPGALKPH